MTASRKLHEHDKLWGAVAKALVAAYALMSGGGKLSSYRRPSFTSVRIGPCCRRTLSSSISTIERRETTGGTRTKWREQSSVRDSSNSSRRPPSVEFASSARP